ncbi:MAG TPA: hypothetical protein VGU71_22410 [Candidatus Dormibacteraeota bacterium]|nr:hypothetical protein [Candidatus Dormibacteraeota bacterium]
MRRRYAEDTEVPVASSQADLQRLVIRAGADQCAVAWDQTQGAAVRFRLAGRYAQLHVPPPTGKKLAELRLRRPRTDDREIADQEERRCWRALLLLVKAKLEAIESGITTAEREFMPDLLLADGRRLEQWAAPELAAMYETGSLPALPAIGSHR